MKMKIIFLIALLSVLSKSCDDKAITPKESFEIIHVYVNKGELKEYDTTIDNFIGAVKVVDSTVHHKISELFVDSTGFNVYHRYQPIDDYHGTDTLKLRSERINDTSDEVISIKNVTVILVVR